MRGALLAIPLLVLGALLCPDTTHGQAIVAPTTGDVTMASSITTAPSNTGNDVASSPNGSQLRVMCWDGATPAFGFQFYNGATGVTAAIKIQNILGPTITGGIKIADPDIVVNQVPGNTSNWYIMLVYVVQSNNSSFQNRIYSEVWTYNASTNSVTNTGAPTQASTLSTACSNPNVDASRNYDVASSPALIQSRAVIVYEQGGVIRARTRNAASPDFSAGSGGSFTPVSIRSFTSGATNVQPDVAVHDFSVTPVAGGPTTPYSQVTVVFVETTTGTSSAKNVRVVSSTFSSVATGASATGAICSYQTPLVTHIAERPRVAAQFFLDATYATDWAVTFRKNETGADDEIYVAASSGGTVTQQTINNDLTGCPNIQPAIAYSGDLLLVDWTYSGNCLTGSTNTTDVIARRLYWIGNPVDVDYLRVNAVFTGTQAVPCVAGRFVNDYNTFFGWYAANVSQMRFKRSFYNNNPLRPGRGIATAPAPATGLGSEIGRVQLYPNPATGAARLRLTLPFGETPTDVRVVDLKTGSSLNAMVPAAALRGEEVALQALLPAGAPAGLYVLRLTTSAGVYTERFEYQP